MNKNRQFVVNNSGRDEITTQVDLKNYVLLLFGLVICCAIIHFYNIEKSFQLLNLFLLVIPSFAIHAKLPLSYRQPFLFLVNLIAILLLFGAWPGIGIIIFGLLLFAAVSLPIRIVFRALLSLLLGGILVLGKLEYIPIPDFSSIATVIGGMFMFRSVVFLYEKQYEKESAGFWVELNYFFLLPNLIFLFFPVVDYKTFVRSYYNVSAKTNYYKGLLWIMRGLFHLMIYRIVYYYFLPSPIGANTFFDILQYITLSYVLIIRLSGVFHLSAGILTLFGLNLPATFDNYFLATGFSDLWRRINIYWKDFMMKIFYFPIFFKFKKRNNKAIFMTVMIVFVINWLLHQYQWFWIRGNFPIRWIDVIFWLSLGVLVALNSIYQKNNKKKKATGFSAVNALKESLKIIGMFLFMSVLWSFWTSPSIDEWIRLMTSSGLPNRTEWTQSILGVGVIVILGVGFQYIQHWWEKNKQQPNDSTLLKIFSTGSLIFAILGSPQVSKEIAHLLAFDVEPILEMKLNKADEEQLFEGYYETLLVGNNFTSRMWEVEEETKKKSRKRRFSLLELGVEYEGTDLIGKRLNPNMQVVYKKAMFSTNEFGMRDRSYTLKKSPGVLRIALLGGSNEMGAGVDDNETFENIVEDFINEQKIWPAFTKVEILNFSIKSAHLAEQVGMAEQRILSFEPDVLMYCIHNVENEQNLKGFAKTLQRPIIEEYPFLKQIAVQARVKPSTPYKLGMELLRPFQGQLEEWGLDRIMAVCKSNSLVPVCISLKALSLDNKLENLDSYKQKGFHVLDLSQIYEGMNEQELQLGKWDRHFNAEAHSIVAEELIKVLKNDKELNQTILRKSK